VTAGRDVGLRLGVGQSSLGVAQRLRGAVTTLLGRVQLSHGPLRMAARVRLRPTGCRKTRGPLTLGALSLGSLALGPLAVRLLGFGLTLGGTCTVRR
jgi:hypothetical protein